MSDEIFEYTRVLQASPSAIFEVLSTPAGHVRIDSSGMLQSAEGSRVTAVGDEFVVHMDREALGDLPMGRYDVTVIITNFEADRWIEWTISGTIQPPLQHRFGYRLDPVQDGTRVTSYYDWSDLHPAYRELVNFPVIPEGSIRATLGILARTVETPRTAG